MELFRPPLRMLGMKTIEAEPAIAKSLGNLVAALAGRIDFPASYEHPTPKRPFAAKPTPGIRSGASRKDFERAWKTY